MRLYGTQVLNFAPSWHQSSSKLESKHMHSNIANGINGFFEEKDFPNIYSCVELCTTLRVPLLQWDLTVKKLISKVQEAFL